MFYMYPGKFSTLLIHLMSYYYPRVLLKFHVLQLDDGDEKLSELKMRMSEDIQIVLYLNPAEFWVLLIPLGFY